MVDVYMKEKLRDKVTHLESEARMIIPGIKALFGFQLVVVFNERFSKELSQTEQTYHWAALGCSALAIVLTLAPAAYHRQAEEHTVSTRLTRLTNRWLTIALFPLLLGYCIDFYLIGIMILKNPIANAMATSVLFLAFVSMWYIYPLYAKKAYQSECAAAENPKH
jgi:ABC-type multidrug transport system permease subunit